MNHRLVGVHVSEPLALEVHLAALKEIFRPASPTVDRTLFKGRDRELSQVIGAIQEVGMHAVIYGERGVGKTSLGYMARAAFSLLNPLSLTLRITCNMEDDFDSIWGKLPGLLRAQLDDASNDLRELMQPIVDRADDILEIDGVTPDNVARALQLLGRHAPTLVIVDEFDRIGDWESTRLFPDLIKAMSDDPATCTVVLIGVADDVDGLVQGHASIDRALRQIHMPRMTREELIEIVDEGMELFRKRVGSTLVLEPSVTRSIARLSQGFPYYTHLLAGSIVERALRDGVSTVNQIMVVSALLESLDSASQSIKVTYADAVRAQQNARYADTLLACALASTNVEGFFAASDVMAPLSALAGVQKKQADFNHHLNRFVNPPSRILEQKGTTRYFYRFADPLMKPFVLMMGIKTGMMNLPDAEEESDVQTEGHAGG